MLLLLLLAALRLRLLLLLLPWLNPVENHSTQIAHLLQLPMQFSETRIVRQRCTCLLPAVAVLAYNGPSLLWSPPVGSFLFLFSSSSDNVTEDACELDSLLHQLHQLLGQGVELGVAADRHLTGEQDIAPMLQSRSHVEVGDWWWTTRGRGVIVVFGLERRRGGQVSETSSFRAAIQVRRRTILDGTPRSRPDGLTDTGQIKQECR